MRYTDVSNSSNSYELKQLWIPATQIIIIIIIISMIKVLPELFPRVCCPSHLFWLPTEKATEVSLAATNALTCLVRLTCLCSLMTFASDFLASLSDLSTATWAAAYMTGYLSWRLHAVKPHVSIFASHACASRQFFFLQLFKCMSEVVKGT